MRTLCVSSDGQLSMPKVSKPTYGDCQALVRTLSCGVCNGTDMKLIHGTFKNMNQYPMLLGHEAVGRVIEKGNKVTSFEVGDIVLLPFLYEDTDGYTCGWGGYSEYGLVGDVQAYIANGMGPGSREFDESFFAQSIIKPSDKVDSIGAAMIITFREVLSAIKRYGFEANRDIVIFGAGPVGLCFTRFSKLLGLRNVVTVDIMDDKITEAKKMGADYVLNSNKVDVILEIHKLFPEGVDYVVDAVGINALLNQGMELIRNNGKICGYGISPKLGMDLDWSKAPYNWSLDFVQFPSKKEESLAHSQIMAWINSGVLNPYDFISDVIKFNDILSAFKLVEKRLPTTKKIVIQYE